VRQQRQDYLLTLAIALLNDVNVAEDVLHDVFVSFVNSAENFRLYGSLKAYLASCVLNRARDHVRANQRHPDQLEEANLISSEANGPEQSVIYSEETQRLNYAIAKLPYEQREAVVMHLKGGLKFREIAKLQGVPINTVQGRYRYGLDKLRSLLDGEVEK
jgi:RNA polymerase sigma-70 factor (ECF subfamily)